MGSCYSGDHIAHDHKHKVITTYNTEKPQQLYRFKIAWNDIGQSCLSRQVLITLLPVTTFMSDGQTNASV